MWLTVVLTLHVVGGAPPPPVAAPRASAWSCSRATLASGELCALDGTSEDGAPSVERGKANAKSAEAMFEQLCRAALVGAPEAVAASTCARARASIGAACGLSSSPLVDELGRFNRGHAACYAAMRGALQDIEAVATDAHACCSCASTQCKNLGAACHARLLQRTPLDAACAASCGSACAPYSARAALAPRAARRTP